MDGVLAVVICVAIVAITVFSTCKIYFKHVEQMLKDGAIEDGFKEKMNQ